MEEFVAVLTIPCNNPCSELDCAVYIVHVYGFVPLGCKVHISAGKLQKLWCCDEVILLALGDIKPLLGNVWTHIHFICYWVHF
jgi:hypothetical protein